MWIRLWALPTPFSLTSCFAMIITVFRENLLPHKLNKSSNDGPNSSNTIALYRPPQVPRWYTLGTPSARHIYDINFCCFDFDKMYTIYTLYTYISCICVNILKSLPRFFSTTNKFQQFFAYWTYNKNKHKPTPTNKRRRKKG